MYINICSAYDPKKPKAYNNNKVANGWHLEEVKWEKDEIIKLTTMNGISCNEYKSGHKVANDWVATYAIMLDFDDGTMTVDDLSALQKKWEYNSYVYNSQNHQKEKDGKPRWDRLRALIPLSEPIHSDDDREAVKNALINYFKKKGKNLDATFMDKARYYAHGGIVVSSFIGDKGPMNWKNIPDLYQKKGRGRPKKSDNCYFRLDDNIKDKDGEPVKIADVHDKTIIYCPICGDAPYRSNNSHNGFIDINDDGLPFIFCSSCQARHMGFNGTGIYNLHPDDAYYIKSSEYQTAVFIDTIQSSLYSIGHGSRQG